MSKSNCCEKCIYRRRGYDGIPDMDICNDVRCECHITKAVRAIPEWAAMYALTDIYEREGFLGIQRLLTTREAEIIETARRIAEKTARLPEQVNGFQPFGYCDEEKEKQVYFEGFNDGRNMMIIDFSLTNGRFHRALKEALATNPKETEV